MLETQIPLSRPTPTPGGAGMNQDRSRLIIDGRAYVRLIEAADVLLAGARNDAERALLHKMRQTYTRKLHELIGQLPPKLPQRFWQQVIKLSGQSVMSRAIDDSNQRGDLSSNDIAEAKKCAATDAAGTETDSFTPSMTRASQYA